LDRDLNNRQIIFNNESTAGFDNTRNLALTSCFHFHQTKISLFCVFNV
jgi:hypothetical protein